jgi:Rad3-related DNA helicase
MESQRLDMLNHYRAAFESGREIDAEYFEKFAALIESFDMRGRDAKFQEQSAALAEAGRRQDAQKIREILPAFCGALRERKNSGGGDEALREILVKLKKAVLAEETGTAETIMGEMGALNLSPSGRELYFLLYDLLLTGDNEKAVGAISLWEKLHQIRYNET